MASLGKIGVTIRTLVGSIGMILTGVVSTPPNAVSATGDIQLIPLPDQAVFDGPDMPIIGPDGNVWFLEYGANANKLAFIVPTPPYKIKEFPLPATPGGVAQIAVGSDGNIWYASTGTVTYEVGGKPGTYGEILPRAPYTITQFPAPVADYFVSRIAGGPDGNIWALAFPGQGAPAGSTAKLLQINPHTKKLAFFPTPKNVQYGWLLPGLGRDFWFYGEAGADNQNVVGRFSLSHTDVAKVFPVPAGGGPDYVSPTDLIWGIDGNLWFPDWMSINHLSPTASPNIGTPIQQAAVYPQAVGLTFGPDKNLWFTQENFSTIAVTRMIPTYPYQLTTFPLTGPKKLTLGPGHMVSGPGNNLWVTVSEYPTGGAIARVEVTP